MKILFVDIETAPNIAYVWGLWDQNISHDQVETSSYLLCWAAKWAGAKHMAFHSIQKESPKHALEVIHAMLNRADIVVHYNGLKFDIPVLNKEFVKHGMLPPAPYKQIDLLQVCRRVFRFESNKLVSVVKALGLGKKLTDHTFELWTDCMKGDKKAWREMEAYNRHDVILLERLYHRLLPWISKHPTVAAIDKLGCPKCGSTRTQRRGEQVTTINRYARYQCQKCGGWFRGNQSIKQAKTEKGVSL
jgi:uncharacterized protein